MLGGCNATVPFFMGEGRWVRVGLVIGDCVLNGRLGNRGILVNALIQIKNGFLGSLIGK